MSGATTPTAAEAVKLFAKQSINITIVKTDKQGNPQRDPETGRFITLSAPLAASHILGVGTRGDEVVITTVDGQKYSAAAQ